MNISMESVLCTIATEETHFKHMYVIVRIWPQQIYLHDNMYTSFVYG